MSIEKLKDESLLIILTFAPAGMGHLRATNALYHALPKEASPVLLGSSDHFIRNFHRFLSIHPLTRAVVEGVQSGFLADIFARGYRYTLQSRVETLWDQLSLLLEQRMVPVKKVLVIATHFGFAHQLGAIKDKLAKEKGIDIKLVVIVTDDTAQPIWYVPEADMITVPSEHIKKLVMDYGKKFSQKPKIEQLSYPLAPVFAEKLSPEEFDKKLSQTNPTHHPKIHISIPISGAAVWTNFYLHLIRRLNRKYSDFVYHLVARKSPNTLSFLEQAKNLNGVLLYTSNDEKEVVNLYEKIYAENTIAFEVTKPSELAFKAILKPKRIGGPIMLFSEPVGKQERDNLFFLERHHMIPSTNEHRLLYEMALSQKDYGQEVKNKLFIDAKNWRGLSLPKGSKNSADFIFWGLNEGLFTQMMNYIVPEKFNPEVNPYGTREFWEKVANLYL